MANLWDEREIERRLIDADAAGDDELADALADRLSKIRKSRAELGEMGDPAKGQSTFSNIAAGVGKSVMDTGRGIGQMLGLVDQQTVDEAARLDRPLMDTGAGVGGNIGGQVLQMAVPGGALAKAGMVPKALQTGRGALGAAALSGGAFAATQPVLSGETRLANTAKGAAYGAAGQGAAQLVGKAARGAADTLEPEVKRLAAKAESFGIPITLAQLSDSRFVQTLKSVVDKLPFSGAAKMNDRQIAAFNKAVAGTFGEKADKITPDVAAAAKRRIGGMFDSLSARNTLKADSQLVNDLVSVVDDANRFGTADNARMVQNLVDDLLSKTKDGKIPGRTYREFDSKIGKLMKGGGDKAAYLGDLRGVIRDAMDRSISPADSKAWQTARAQYRNLKTVEDLIEKADAGDLSPALLLNAVRKSNPNFAYGSGGDLADLARIGQQFLKDRVPNSGTAERLIAGSAILGGGSALGIDPLALGGAALVGRGLGGALNSGRLGTYMQQGSPLIQNYGVPLARPLPFLFPAAANAQQQEPPGR